MKIVRLLSGSFAEGENKVSEDKKSLEKPAMLVYTGEFESMDGPVTIADEDIEQLAANHNAFLSKLSRLATGEHHPKHNPPIQLDHSTSAKDTVGRLVGNLTVGEHTDENGNKVKALFGTARILGTDNVEKVEDGRWTHLSGGFDLETHRLTELTITPFPAAADASLLSARRLALGVKEGDRVKVSEGKHAGKAGTVVAVDGDYAIVKVGGFEQKIHVGDLTRLSAKQLASKVVRKAEGPKADIIIIEYSPGNYGYEIVTKKTADKIDDGDGYDSSEQALQAAKKVVSTYTKSYNFSESSTTNVEGDEMPSYKELKEKLGMYEKCKKRLMDKEKLSEEEAEEKLSAMDDENLSKMSAEADEEEAKLAAEETKEKEAELKRMGALKDHKSKLVQLSKDIKSANKNVQLAAKKSGIQARLASLASAQKITPAEMKSIKLSELAAKSDEVIQATLSSYEKREPVIDVGLFGSTKALTPAQLGKTVKKLGSEVNELKTRLGMPSKRAGALKRLQELGLTEHQLEEGVQVHIDNVPDGEHDVDFEASFETLKKLLAEGKDDEAKTHLKSMGGGAAEAVPLASDSVAEMSALAEEVKKMQTNFDEVVKLAAPVFGATIEELT